MLKEGSHGFVPHLNPFKSSTVFESKSLNVFLGSVLEPDPISPKIFFAIKQKSMSVSRTNMIRKARKKM